MPSWRLRACGKRTPLCRVQQLNLHLLPDEFHFLLHYFLFTAIYIIIFSVLLYYFFYTHNLLHSIKALIECSLLPSLIFIFEHEGWRAEADMRHVGCWNVSIFSGNCFRVQRCLVHFAPGFLLLAVFLNGSFPLWCQDSRWHCDTGAADVEGPELCSFPLFHKRRS